MFPAESVLWCVALAGAAMMGASSTQNRKPPMKASHLHVGVRDLAASVAWLENVWQLKPGFRNDRMAMVPFGSVSLILDAAEADSVATVAFASSDCDGDFQAVVERGAVPIEKPTDRPWGVRSAYVRGPGALKFEIEQPLRKRPSARTVLLGGGLDPGGMVRAPERLSELPPGPRPPASGPRPLQEGGGKAAGGFPPVGGPGPQGVTASMPFAEPADPRCGSNPA